MEFSEAKEYVQEQLKLMGLDRISQQELERYTLDFIQLLKDKGTNKTFEEDTEASDVESTASSTSMLVAGQQQATPTGKVVEVSMNRVNGKLMKRKVLRKLDMVKSEMETSRNVSTDVSTGLCSEDNDLSRNKPSLHQPPPPLKSFIRPSFTHPHMKGFQKCDPVQRYHEFREMWENQKPPGEKPRNSLRWHIREQLVQDTPLYAPPRPIRRPSDYIVPTNKKRQALRWEVRHQLAN